MVEDFVRRKGYLTLGTRLKRIGDRLQADVQQLIDAEGVAVQTGQYPLLAAIDEQGPMTVGDLAEALGVSQPGITRSVGQLAKQGVVTVARGPKDQRTKVVTLTRQGQDIVDQGKRDLWPLIDESLAAICEKERGNILDQLDRLERALQENSLFQRIKQNEKANIDG
ncbi:MarR family transcriptional regulator [Sneathiella sp.]|uniref:MarR family winged helix-turn-helix transcriptional regulator n=1 Tax=Sneathiella sp. TaxID=1964365 RepID=UPI0026076767|nr:MarR family transcriptional regulator [Sneathiella sp.]MDF2367868.1 MarR family transcriptional regulator [Sneathiella sp.]